MNYTQQNPYQQGILTEQDFMNSTDGQLQLNKRRDSLDVDAKIDDFVKDFKEFYRTGKDINASITQSYWYSLCLCKKRLDKYNLSVEYNMSITSINGDKFYQSHHWSYDGKNTTVVVENDADVEKVYYLNGNVIKKSKSTCGTAYFTVVQSKTPMDECVCPSCGAVQTVEQLIDGCDYCGTKFQLEDFDKKIVSFNTEPSPLKKFSAFYKSLLICFLAPFPGGLALAILQNFGLYATEGTPLYYVAMLFPICMIYAFVGFVLSMFLPIDTQKKARIAQQAERRLFQEKMQSFDELFSVDNFVGTLDYKLKNIHFADSQQNIDSFVACDISDDIHYYKNIVDCTFVGYRFNDYRVFGNVQKLFLTVTVTNSILVNNKICSYDEEINLTLRKSADVKTQCINDAVVYRCKGCGSPISLLNGGVCQYCDTKLDLMQYDWVIEKYEPAIKNKK
ncbi:MAG TPA: hypothetical protein GX401_07230 [Clostridiales bacterium]|nr:hypothetical protein [Clostridiales bacterium]